jgi:hypothetical protein
MQLCCVLSKARDRKAAGVGSCWNGKATVLEWWWGGGHCDAKRGVSDFRLHHRRISKTTP